jgi:hypothetical protein
MDSKIMTPHETKNILFDRVLKGQMSKDNIFRLVYDMNDIVSIIISNPWTENLIELEKHLLKHSRLNLFSKLERNGVTHLIGRTDIGTTYEIVLVPELIKHWMQWKKKNSILPTNRHISSLNNILNTQKIIDNNSRLR